jgi:predicted phage terminase large subunit-like protein
MHAIKKYEPKMHKIMRMDSVTGTIENGFVYVPDKASWLTEYLHELTIFTKGKYDDQMGRSRDRAGGSTRTMSAEVSPA